MRSRVNYSLWVLVVLGAFGSVLSDHVLAQGFKSLHTFSALSAGGTNIDGFSPKCGLTASGNILYGTTSRGGNSDSGTVFKINFDGTDFTPLYSFADLSDDYTNRSGAWPRGALTVSGNTLYGTASGGGIAEGTVFKLSTNGTGFVVLHEFTVPDPGGANTDGLTPIGGLVLSGNTLYGTASMGGNSGTNADGLQGCGNGTVFKVSVDGTGFTPLYRFTWFDGWANFSGGTNIDGANPVGGLTLSGTTLYGTTSAGGTGGSGTIFKVSTNGTGFAVLHNFAPLTNAGRMFGTIDPVPVNDDGAWPVADLTLVGNILYGTTSVGGPFSPGTVFAINTDGTGFRILHVFSGGDGAASQAGLAIDGGTLYGTTSRGGAPPGSWGGVVFKLNTDGSDFRILHAFTGGYDGDVPWGGVIISGNTLYGTTDWEEGSGTIFSLSIPPELRLIATGQNLVLSWPTNFTGYTLQQSGDLASRAWTTYSFLQTPPIINNGQFVVTIPNNITNRQQFFRLGQ